MRLPIKFGTPTAGLGLGGARRGAARSGMAMCGKGKELLVR